MQALADFLETLEEAGQLVRIPVEVDPSEEIAAITTQVAVRGGPALLFEKVRGHRLAIVSNLLGCEDRVCRAMGVEDVTALQERVASLWQPASAPATGWLGKLRGGNSGDSFAPPQPRAVRNAPCQQIVQLGSDVDLGTWPLVTQSAGETGPSLIGGLVYTIDPDSGVRHVTQCNLQMVGPRQLVPSWHSFSAAARDLAACEARGESMPVAVMLGGDPSHTLVAATLFEADWDVVAWTSHLTGLPGELARCRTHGLEVPAEAELVIEGLVDPSIQHEQPSTSTVATGYYRDLLGQPVVEVSAITHRNGPILPVNIDATARQTEQAVLGRVATRMFLPLLQRAVPEVVDIALPYGDAARSFAAASMKKAYPMQARNVAGGLWNVPWLLGLKMLVLVDEDVDVHDTTGVLHAVATQVDPRRDVWVEDAASHPLNHATGVPGVGSRMVIDATAKSAAERGGVWPAKVTLSAEVSELLRKRWAEYGLPERFSPPGLH